LKPKIAEPILFAIGLHAPEAQRLLADKWLNSLERAMKDRLFVQPVFVKVNAYISREIASLMDALDYLEEWPEERRDLMHETVVQAGYDVFEGRKPLETFEKAGRCREPQRSDVGLKERRKRHAVDVRGTRQHDRWPRLSAPNPIGGGSLRLSDGLARLCQR
jgi:hypothetical protein